MRRKSQVRVLMLVENNSFPEDVRVLPEAQALIEEGYRVSVISPARKGQHLYQKINGIVIFRFPFISAANNFLGYFIEYGYSLVAMFLLSLIVAIWPGFDIIHSANPPDTLILIGIFFKIFKKKYVFDHHDLMPELFKLRFESKGRIPIYKWLLRFEGLSCRYADHIIATNQSYKALEMKRWGVQAANITVVRNGPPEHLGPVEPEKGLRQEGKFLIAYMGVIGYQDGLDHLIEALRYIVNDLGKTDIVCIIMGNGDALPMIKKLATRYNLDPFIQYTGWIEHSMIAKYLSAADICVAPEPSNPYNDRCTIIKLMEYMAIGKPIVAFDLPEHHITAQGGAVYAQSNNDQDFALKIISLAENPMLCKQIGQTGRDRVANTLSWSHQKKNLIKAYRVLVASK
jgi:glycosyltransferase involved in cell wall biosynthesis